MKPFAELDVYTVPLAGPTLIEASAGTGKTWTIAGLYVRLLLECGFSLDRILVVTFTRAATAELRERLRARLVQLQAVLPLAEAGSFDEIDDEFCRKLLSQYADSGRLAAIREPLRVAVECFDEAAISTIHGFCQRALADFAFTGGINFELTMVEDPQEKILRVLEDRWRQEAARAEGPWGRYLFRKRDWPDQWKQTIGKYIGKPFAVPVAVDVQDSSVILASHEEACQHFVSAGEEAIAEAVALLREQIASLHGTYYKAEKLDELESAVSAVMEQGPCADIPEVFRLLTRDFIDDKTKADKKTKQKSPPQHPVYDKAQTLFDASHIVDSHFEQRRVALFNTLLREVITALEQDQQEESWLSHDSMLSRLRGLLAGPQGPALAAALRSQFPVALIDEFQDTDPQQFEIFRTIYSQPTVVAGAEEQALTPVFFVGDPKQAIYSFRGADIFTYLQAEQFCVYHWTLLTNQRSTPAYVQAMNQLFSPARPFLLDEIDYPPVKAAEKSRAELRHKAEGSWQPVTPLEFLLMPEYGATRKADIISEVAESTAAEIGRMLTGSRDGTLGFLENEADQCGLLQPGHIAVLVNSHKQSAAMQAALQALGIPSVMQSQQSVWQTATARDLHRLLVAVHNPWRDGAMSSLLATDLFALSITDIQAWREDGPQWEALLFRFDDYRQQWQQQGILAMLRSVLLGEGLAARLLAREAGDRVLTDYLHLSELLEEIDREESDFVRVLRRVREHLQDDKAGGEGAQLRLESDDDRVKLVTIHASKGLQYPVVFCPYLWEGPRSSPRAPFSFHEGNVEYIDFGSPQVADHAVLAEREQLAEKLRVLYVALTRSVYACRIVWGKFKSQERAALSYLLYGDKGVEGLKEVFKGQQWREELNALCDASSGTIALREIESEARPLSALDEQELQGGIRHPKRVVRELFATHSFTSLTQQAGHEHEAVLRRDEPEVAVQPPDVQAWTRSIFTFPKGARAGTCWHAVYEDILLDRKRLKDLPVWVERALTTHGFDVQWRDVLEKHTRVVMNRVLTDDGMTLATINSPRPELEFTMNAGALTMSGLIDAVSPFATPGQLHALQQLRFDKLRGFLKGFMDLVGEHQGRYWILDYKSNWLGGRAEDYHQEALEQAVNEAHYFLQYWIYIVALHRLLKSRLKDYDYDRHVGGAAYLFLRGITAETGNTLGIWVDRPARGLIEALDAWLQQGGQDIVTRS